MGWEDRPYYRDYGASSNPLAMLISGSVPMFTIRGIRVRAHSALIAFILCELLLDWSQGYDLASKIVSMAMLFGIVLLHEFGHCIAARLVGGSADEILLWPLGGLAFPDTPQRPGARFWTAAGGPLVNVLICIAAGVGVYVLGAHATVSLNPLANPLAVPIKQSWHWQTPAFYFWWVFVISYLLLVLNLLPIFPLDGGRIVQCTLWKIFGYHRSMLLACITGMGGSVALAAFALWSWNSLTVTLLLLAGCLFYYCFQERRVLREAGPGESWQGADADYSSVLYRDPDTSRRSRVARRAQRIARKHAREAAADRARLDAILAKVSAQGLHSLTWRERRTLRLATERRRQQDLDMKDLLEK
jgi:Zn-dependent protease